MGKIEENWIPSRLGMTNDVSSGLKSEGSSRGAVLDTFAFNVLL